MTRKIPPLIPEISTDKCVMFCVTNYADTRKSARAVGPGTDCAHTHATEAEAGAEQSGFEPHLDFGQRSDEWLIDSKQYDELQGEEGTVLYCTLLYCTVL